MKKILIGIFTPIIQTLFAQQMCNTKEASLKYIMQYAGLPYIWAGDDPVKGFDCSGLAVEYLKSAGVLNNGDDFTAAQLFKMFAGVEKPERGDLVFWKNTRGKIIHVEIMINDFLSIGASGGGSKTLTIQDAIKKNAYIKQRNIYNRKGIAGFNRPLK